MYTSLVLDHFERPRNIGVLPGANGVGLVGSPATGDVLQLQLQIAPVAGVETVVDARAKVSGCAAAIAAASYLTECLKGRPLAAAAALGNRAIAQALGLPPVKVHCSVLAEDALRAALQDHRRRGAAGPGTAARMPA